MRRRFSSEPATCTRCSTPTHDPRRGLCPKCYQREYHGRELASACECCGQADPRVLVRRRLDGANWTTLCANCAAVAGKRTMRLAELVAELHREGDRRTGDRRKCGDRRRGERRAPLDRRILDRNTPERRQGDRRDAAPESGRRQRAA